MFGSKKNDIIRETYEVERFLYREARLLDERLHHEWLHLLAEDFRYVMPLRHTPHPNSEHEGKDALWAVENELSNEHEIGFYDENKLNISIRVARSRQVRAWADSPAPRTRRVIGNVELESADEDGALVVRSNVLLSHARMGDAAKHFSAGRVDRLRRDERHGFLLVHRRVTPDWTVFPNGSMNFYF